MFKEGVVNLPIYIDSIPYLKTQYKKVALPKSGTMVSSTGKVSGENKNMYGNLVFLFTDNIDKSIKMVNNNINCYHDNKYRYFYYNLLYRGMIGAKRYNIRDAEERKAIYKKISEQTSITPHPPTLLNKTANYNCYYDMSKYCQIYSRIADNFAPVKKMNVFWNYFRSIWFSEQCENYPRKIVLIDANLYDKFGMNLRENMSNPLFVLYYTFYRAFDKISDLNIDFVIYCNRAVLRVNPSQCDQKSYQIFKRELFKVFSRKVNEDALNEKHIDEQDQKETIKEAIQQKYNFTGSKNDEEEITSLNDTNTTSNSDAKKEAASKKIEEKIDKKVEQKVAEAKKELKEVGASDNSKEATEYIKAKTEMELDDDKDLIEDMYNFMKTEKVPSKPVSTARDAQLRKRQESLSVKDISLLKINEMNNSKRKIPVKDVSKNIHSINKNVQKVKFNNLNKDYIENVMPEDIAKVFTSLNDKSMKFYVKNIKVEETSNELNYKETWHIQLEDELKQQHSITVDIPKFLDDKFLYLGGNKKIINKQNFLYPVVKTAPDTVQIVTNYNKMFIRRVGTKSISSVERMMKLISSNDECQKFFTVGNNSSINRAYLTTIEYDEFGKVLTQFETPKCIIFFNQKNAKEYADSHQIEIPEHRIFIGIKDKNPVFIDSETQTTDNGESICDLIITELPESMQKEFNKTRSTKKLMYSNVTIMTQPIPFIVLLIYWEGITSVFKKMDIKYYFSQKYPSSIKSNENVIRFKDCYFVYESDLAIDLLMNGLRVLDTENYDFKEYNTEEPFVEYFKKVYGKAAIMSAISNYYDFEIDPITKEILEDINLPTDLIELCIYANSLLADESYTAENSQVLSRVRSSEVIPAILYYELSKTYLNYKNSMGKKKLSIPKDAVIKQLLSLQTVEDYSTLNPVVELDKDRAITSKGYRGINVDRAYTEEKRSYDDSMIGVMAMSTTLGANCGIGRFLTLEPELTSVRGYANIKKDNREELTDVNLFSPSELLYPLGNTRDDSIRTAMATKQSKHVVPVKNATPALISNGVDEVIKYNLSSDFVINADEDGTVIDYDDKSKILMVEYKSGKHRAINLAPNIVKNGGGGFYISNELITKYKVGDKFKKDDTLAYHKDFFRDDKFNGIRMNVGVLEKVAIMSSYDTYNDSAMITEKLARDAETELVFCKPVVLGKNSNIYDIRKIGDHVEIGDSLINFDTSFDDTDLNKLLANLSDENKEVLQEGSINQVKSKYAGTIVDIKIYSTVDIPELSESLQKIVKTYYNRVNNKKKFVSKYDNSNSIVKCGLLLNETTGKIEPNIYGVIKGQKVQDSVLIEFYIQHGDIMGVGDKMT